MGIQLHSTSFYVQKILFPLFLSCTSWNMVRRTLGEAAPKLIDEGFLDQSNYASMNTVAFIIYGLSKFVTSHIAKNHLFLWYSILFGIVGILTLLCGMFCSAHYYLFFVSWVVNYMFMGTLWPIICIVFKRWFPESGTYNIVGSLVVRGLFWSIICCCSSLGTIICNTISVYVNGNPNQIYCVCGMIVLVCAFITFFIYPTETSEDVLLLINIDYRLNISRSVSRLPQQQQRRFDVPRFSPSLSFFYLFLL